MNESHLNSISHQLKREMQLPSLLIVLSFTASILATRTPTRKPSVVPSQAPSIFPSEAPTAPTATPTVSLNPTTISPTVFPTIKPIAAYPDCPRVEGQYFVNPANVTSKDGYVDAYLNFRSFDAVDEIRYCYMITQGELDGNQSPVLRAYPGDTMLVTLTNDLDYDPEVLFALKANDFCLQRVATRSSTNMHFHGFHSRPVCRDDNIVMTVINAHESFTYVVDIPTTQPPGLYWYHPHMHTVANDQVGGGASGVMIIEGIENIQPEVAGLPEQIMVFRQGAFLHLNYIIINETSPVLLSMKPGLPQFWRIANTFASGELNFTITIDGVYQPFTLIALDGVVLGSHQTALSNVTTHVYLPAGGRAEIIVTAPIEGKIGFLNSEPINFRLTNATDKNQIIYEPAVVTQLVKMIPDSSASDPPLIPARAPTVLPDTRVPEDLLLMTPANKHNVYFFQNLNDGNNLQWFVKVDNETEIHEFNPNAAPAITAVQGTVEEWTIINNTTESHDFHIHQMHFIVTKMDGIDVPEYQKQYRDTIVVPHQDRSKTPNAVGQYVSTPHSVTILVDFTGDIVGDFVMHCHILFHEDHGMMRIVRVNASNTDVYPALSPTTNDDDNDDSARDTGLYIVIAVLGFLVVCLSAIIVYYRHAIFPSGSSNAQTNPADQANQADQADQVTSNTQVVPDPPGASSTAGNPADNPADNPQVESYTQVATVEENV